MLSLIKLVQIIDGSQNILICVCTRVRVCMWLRTLVTFHIVATNGHTVRGVVGGCLPEPPPGIERMRLLFA